MPIAGSPNQLKRALAEGRPQIGIWSSLCSAMAVEVVADSGFDWMLIDAEHAPNDLSQVVTHLQAAARYPALMGRPAGNQAWAVVPFMGRTGAVGGVSLNYADPQDFPILVEFHVPQR